MMLNAQRLRDRMAEMGMSQAELGRRVGVSQATIFRLTRGDAHGSSHLHRIARELGTTAEYLTDETDDATAGALPAATAETIAQQLDLVEIQQIDLAYGLGRTFVDGHVEIDVLQFPRQWIEAITPSPPTFLTWARGRGDSMRPTIFDGDLVLLDRSQRRVEELDAIWAFTVGDVGGIKRLRPKGDRMLILSDNKEVPPDEELIADINIIARVVFIGRRT